MEIDTLVTANCTAWSSLTGFLAEGAGGADALLVQEHHLGEAECCREEAWARGTGWSTSLCPAVPTGRGGTSGGVGMLTRSFRGLGRAPGRKEAALIQGRAAMWSWNGGGVPGGLLVVSVYLECGVGMNDGNWDILKAVAEELKMLGRPF